MDFRERIIRYRDEKGLSQQELADLLQVTRQTVSRWESGKSRPQPGQAAHIFELLQIREEDVEAEEAFGAADGERSEEILRRARNEEPVRSAGLGYIRSKKVRIALLVVIGVGELTRQGQEIIAVNFRAFEVWLTVAIFYLAMTLSISAVLRYYERKLMIGRRAVPASPSDPQM